MADRIIEEIRARADIVEIVSDYVALTQVGQRFKGLCPFHQEKTPSFYVNPSMGIFKCFGCGAAGDVFKFLMLSENMTFPEAAKRLGERVGVPFRPAGGGRASSERERLAEINRLAARFFHLQLTKADAAQHARDYLKRRGISDEMATRFGLGCAPDGWDALLLYLRQNRVKSEEAARVGLVVQRADKSGYYDRFRNRLMVPIRDVSGTVIAFGGRTLGNDDAKYINSPESALFTKSRVLFGLNLAIKKVAERDEVVLVEGYLDLIALHQFGFDNAVATMGTSVTAQHAQTLARYTKNLVVCFDADSAGMRAVLRSVPLFEQHDLRVRVLTVPAGDDPDTFVRRVGAEGFAAALRDAPSVVEYRLDQVAAQCGGEGEQARLEMIRRVIPILMEVQRPAEQDAYVYRFTEKWMSGDPRRKALVEEAIRLELETGRRRRRQPQGQADRGDVTKKIAEHTLGVLKAERELVSLMLQDRRRAKEILEKLKPSDFIDEQDQHIAIALVDSLRQPEAMEFHDLVRLLPEQAVEVAESLAVDDISFAQARGAVEDRVQRIHEHRQEQLWREEAQKVLAKLERGEPLTPEEKALLTQQPVRNSR